MTFLFEVLLDTVNCKAVSKKIAWVNYGHLEPDNGMTMND